jgi:hypothetical protein
MKNPELTLKLEDYLKLPVIYVRESAQNTSEMFVFVTNGIVQYNRLSKKRTAIIDGTKEEIQTILKEMFEEYPNKRPTDILCKYSYTCQIYDQIDIRKWAERYKL